MLSSQEFAGDGLRTLALAYKDLDEEYFNQWKQRHHEASTELEDRERKLDQMYEEIEMDLLVGQDAHLVNIDWDFARSCGTLIFLRPSCSCWERRP